MERAPFVAAVQEALMRLPRPGENLYLRLSAQDVDTWSAIIQDPGLPFSCSVLVDADVQPGHAYVEISGARIDVGKEARLALVKTALGMTKSIQEESPSYSPILADDSADATNPTAHLKDDDELAAD